ncbi:MAG: arginine decarboxylase [Gammaproteobacteria bacterium]|nr:MAG: arginine decarboxylase [Gammaproteobacteria bacterium]
MGNWTIDTARDMYNIRGWSGGYFDVGNDGKLRATPGQHVEHPGVSLPNLAAELIRKDLRLPVLVRFSDILHDRVDLLYNAFAEAMQETGYAAPYTPVYPIKVNQQRSVVAEILGHGKGRVGLEAGSKPELMAVLSLSDADGGVIICNGYKDREFIRLALIGQQLGHRVYIVIERLAELELVIEEARAMSITPLLGVRVRLSSLGAGNWQNTGGEKSKFGLTAAQVLRAVERLRETAMLETLKLMHFHMGSQIPNIRDIQQGLHEAVRRNYCSVNYTVQEYATNIVRNWLDVCDKHGLPHPMIITEAGRAMTAHHAVLITNVIDVEQVPAIVSVSPPGADDPAALAHLWGNYSGLTQRSVIEAYHDAVHWLAEAQSLYTAGMIGLAQRAYAEAVYFATCIKIRAMLDPRAQAHREIHDELTNKLADKYFFNLSVFQSIPDVWAINQVFPVVPLQRLDEQPDRRGVVVDMTCDSDGRIDQYVDRDGIGSTLALHSLKDGDPYLIGIFLVGAYQEILGDMHNLFGDTDSVHVTMTDDGGYELTELMHGDTVRSVLDYVHHDSDHLLDELRRKIRNATITETQRRSYIAALEEGLSGYTYLED